MTQKQIKAKIDAMPRWRQMIFRRHVIAAMPRALYLAQNAPKKLNTIKK